MMDDRCFRMTVRYALGFPDPVRQYHGNAQRITQLLTDDVDFTHAIRIEIELQR